MTANDPKRTFAFAPYLVLCRCVRQALGPIIIVRCQMDKIKYAAYGSNLHPIRLSDLVPSAKLLGKGILEGKALRFHKRSKDDSGKCNIIDDDKQQVYVAVYEIDESEKPALGNAEGVGYGYRTEEVKVVGFGKCFTYIAENSHIDDSLKPYTWYKELVLVGCEKLEIPMTYINRIRGVDADEDFEKQRQAKNMELVARAKKGT